MRSTAGPPDGVPLRAAVRLGGHSIQKLSSVLNTLQSAIWRNTIAKPKFKKFKTGELQINHGARCISLGDFLGVAYALTGLSWL